MMELKINHTVGPLETQLVNPLNLQLSAMRILAK